MVWFFIELFVSVVGFDCFDLFVVIVLCVSFVCYTLRLIVA